MAIRTIRTKDFFGEPTDFEILWETVCMTCTFAVGIQTDRRNELTIFHVTNMGGSDIYTGLNTFFLENFYNNSFLLVENIKKEMKKVIKRVLTSRVKCGMITIEQIERWSKNEH